MYTCTLFYTRHAELLTWIAICSGAILLLMIVLIVRAHKVKVLCGQEGLVGLRGEVTGDIKPPRLGKVAVQGTLWNALADEDIMAGDAIEVVSVDNMTLKVRKVAL